MPHWAGPARAGAEAREDGVANGAGGGAPFEPPRGPRPPKQRSAAQGAVTKPQQCHIAVVRTTTESHCRGCVPVGVGACAVSEGHGGRGVAQGARGAGRGGGARGGGGGGGGGADGGGGPDWGGRGAGGGG